MGTQIPKTIHYCWFGGEPLPELAHRCIESWKKYCPDYRIVEWNEKNFDVNCIPFVTQAYQAKKWAFVTDYARLKIIYENGGIYFDTDVELLRGIDDLLALSGFMGTDERGQISTGLGFGAVKNHYYLKTLMDDYRVLPFPSDNNGLEKIVCPILTTTTFEKSGYNRSHKLQVVEGITIFPEDFFSPMDSQTYTINITPNTYSLHHYNASWKSPNRKRIRKLIKMMSSLLGKERTLWIKEKIKNIIIDKS